jgi:hypothetical protein
MIFIKMFTVAQLVKNSLLLRNPNIRHCVSVSPPLYLILNQFNSVNTMKPYVYKTCLILHPNLWELIGKLGAVNAFSGDTEELAVVSRYQMLICIARSEDVKYSGRL